MLKRFTCVASCRTTGRIRWGSSSLSTGEPSLQGYADLNIGGSSWAWTRTRRIRSRARGDRSLVASLDGRDDEVKSRRAARRSTSMPVKLAKGSRWLPSLIPSATSSG